MRKPGWRLIVGATVLLAGCSPGSQSPATPSQPSTLTLTTTSLPSGTVGAAYSSQVAASGGTTPYAYSAASLPSGLSINSATGAIKVTGAELRWNRISNHQGDRLDAAFAAIGRFQPKPQGQPHHARRDYNLAASRRRHVALSRDHSGSLRRSQSVYLGAGIRQHLACRVDFVARGSPLRHSGCRRPLLIDLCGHGFFYSSRDRPGYAHADDIGGPELVHRAVLRQHEHRQSSQS